MDADADDNKQSIQNVVQVVEVQTKEPKLQDVVVRLTPTGKISHAKTRVYTQRYRKEWEHMTDFKDWLCSVPYQATRAFCKYCQRNLHAHRLSLLKHMCTLKHQRAAAQYNKYQQALSTQQAEETDDTNYVIEKLDTEDEDDNQEESFEDVTYNQEGGEEISTEELQEEIVIESDSEENSKDFKRIKLEKEHEPDALAQAMAHVHQDYMTENGEPLQVEVVVQGEDDNDDDQNSRSYEDMEHNVLLSKSNTHSADDEYYEERDLMNDEDVKMRSTSESKDSDNSKKVYIFSTGGKSYTLVKSSIPQVLLNQLNDKNFTIVSKATKSDLKNVDSATTSQQPVHKKSTVINNSGMTTKSSSLKKPIVSTHVLETSKGAPVYGLQVSLYKLQEGRWTFVHESVTTPSGNCNDFLNGIKSNHSTGRYKLHYDVEKYYNLRKIATMYPFIEIVFDVKDPNASYHIPLLLSPFSYSTYKDTQR